MAMRIVKREGSWGEVEKGGRKGKARGWVGRGETWGDMVRVGPTGIGKALREGLWGREYAFLWIVRRVPGSLPVTYNLTPHVLPVFREWFWLFFTLNSMGLQFPTEQGVENLLNER